MDKNELLHRLSPTNFYALLGRAATEAQAKRMIDEHFYNPQEFWGEWIMPSIARNDPAYPEQDYWRGRIWAPMNFLVYLGLRRYPLAKARAGPGDEVGPVADERMAPSTVTSTRTTAGDSGQGCDKGNSDAFYHWGGLLGLIALIEGRPRSPGPELPLGGIASWKRLEPILSLSDDRAFHPRDVWEPYLATHAPAAQGSSCF